ncbi:hypothetical protein KJ975_01360 [Myxococcota bacterium]|nr:hypothetical protein [Myxococcota bacterium]
MMRKTVLTLTLATCLWAWGCDADTKNVDSCGDGFLDPGEECDTDVGDNTCEQLGYYSHSGPLTCKANCTLDRSVCVSRCGDSLIQVNFGEDCDGENLAEMDCSDLGLGRGSLSCKSSCRWETSDCEFSAHCGNDLVEDPYEQCDGENLNGQTCQSLDYSGGQLACGSDCMWDVSSCESPDTCGNGIIGTDGLEECDGDDLGGVTCRGLGYWTGNLSCQNDCTLDLTGCKFFTDLSVGANSACALDDGGNSWCWGNGYDGQLGNGVITVTNIPVPSTMPTNTSFDRISVGTTEVASLTPLGRAWQWGASTGPVPVPVQMPFQTIFLQIVGGSGSSCAVDANADIWCWGSNTHGLLGDGSGEDSSTPVPIYNPDGKSFSRVTPGYSHRCALDSNGTAWCWGNNNGGVLGNGTLDSTAIPTAVAMPENLFFSDISSAGNTVCALDQAGNAWCWGREFLGNGTDLGSSMPVAVTMPDEVSFVSISTGFGGSCALDDTGLAWCWGAYPGNGSTEARSPVPVLMPQGRFFTKVSTNGFVSCGLDDIGMVYCWGDNYDGNLGNCSNLNSTTPVPICEPQY